MGGLVIPVFIPELGCHGRCIFCDQHRISGQGEIPAPSDVRAIIECHLATWDPEEKDTAEVAFFGGTFTNLPISEQQRYLDAVKPYIDAGRVSGVRVSTRPDAIDSAGVELLARGHVWLVELGAQSLDDGVLAATGRGYRSGDVINAVQLIHAGGIKAGLQFMP
jgi:histone acetyltransferase (RNA polymerase elongator complex component)